MSPLSVVGYQNFDLTAIQPVALIIFKKHLNARGCKNEIHDAYVVL